MSRGAKESFLLFVSFHLLYAATSSGDLMADSQVRWETSARFVETGWFDLAEGCEPRCAEGRDGKRYSFYGPAAWGCLVPFVLAGRWIAAMPLPVHGTPDMFGQFFASILFFPACGAFCLVLVYAVAREASQDRRIGRWIAIAVGLATMHWHHSVSTGDETQIAICVLASLWALQRGWKHDAFRYPLLVCIAIGLGPCFRISSIVTLAPLALLGCSFDLAARPNSAARLHRLRRWLIAGVIGVGPWIVFLGWYNAVRFGSILETGHGLAHLQHRGALPLFGTPLFEGLTGMLFSPGKGVFVFNPLLLLALSGLIGLWRTDRRFAVIIASTCASSVLFYAKYTFWSGDFTWGPRYLASLMGVGMLGLIPVLRRPVCRPLVLPLFALSAVIQIASVVYSYGLEFFQDGRHGTIPDAYVWRPGESQLVCRFRNMALQASGRPIYESIPPTVERPELCQTVRSREQVKRMHVVHFFPFKAYANIGSKTLFGGLLALWLMICAALAVTVWFWRRTVRREPTRPTPWGT